MERVCDAGGQFLLIMCDHHHGLVLAAAESLYDSPYQQPSWLIEPMQGLVQNEQFGVFHEGTCQQAKPLFAAAKLEKRLVGQILDTEHAHPATAHFHLFGTGTSIKPHRIMQSAGHDIYGRHVAHIAPVHLGTHISYVVLNLPDAFARTS